MHVVHYIAPGVALTLWGAMMAMAFLGA